MNKDTIEELFDDYISLIACYDQIPTDEVGFEIIRFATKMLLDCATNHKDGIEIVKKGVENGIEWHIEEKKSCKSHK